MVILRKYLKMIKNKTIEPKNTQSDITRVIRKLGNAELVFEAELDNMGCLLPFSLLFESKINLFEHRHKIHKALDAWKKAHPLLCAKIKIEYDPEHAKFSRQRYFVYASKRKIRSMENVR
ncbi:hypothetical protein BpHYR1_048648, partial [Brachionus plicatilis]